MSEDNSRVVLYMLTGGKHAVQLAVSVRALRQHYDGQIRLAYGDAEAQGYCERIARAAGADTVEMPPRWSEKGGKGKHYARKTFMAELTTDCQQTLFLDADTLVVGPIDELWPEVGQVVLTQFADWVSTGRHLRGRIEAWRPYAHRLVNLSLEKAWPAVNTGVLAWDADTEDWHQAWRSVCSRHVSFICDEIAAQLLVPATDPARLRIASDRYNASVVYSQHRYSPQPGSQRAAAIWHGHGMKFSRRPFGRAIWGPHYRAAVAENYAGLADWTPARDRHLKANLHLIEESEAKPCT